MSKVDAILAADPNTSLDDLLAARKINADQKAQALKKPELQKALAQLEEQVAQYKKVDAEYQSRLSSERDTLTKSHNTEIEQLKLSVKKETEEQARSELRKKLLTFSQFLRAAAAKRLVEEEANTDESKAFEGALLLVYGGDDKAVEAAQAIIDGAEEAVPSVEGQPLSVNCERSRRIIFFNTLTDALARCHDQKAIRRAHSVPARRWLVGDRRRISSCNTNFCWTRCRKQQPTT